MAQVLDIFAVGRRNLACLEENWTVAVQRMTMRCGKYPEAYRGWSTTTHVAYSNTRAITRAHRSFIFRGEPCSCLQTRCYSPVQVIVWNRQGRLSPPGQRRNYFLLQKSDDLLFSKRTAHCFRQNVPFYCLKILSLAPSWYRDRHPWE